MPIIGAGISLLYTMRPSAESITERIIRDALGAKLSGLWLGSDIIGDTSAGQWQGRVGGTLTNLLAGRFDIGSTGGKKCIDHAGASVAALVTDVSLTQEVWAVAAPAALPFTGYRMCLGTSISGTPGRYLQGDSGASNWYLGSAPTIFKNGAASNAVDSGLAVYTSRSQFTAGTSSLYVGSDPQLTADLARVWRGKIAAIMTLNATSTAGQLATCTAALKGLYLIP
jgi:hypothetical protein